MDKDRIKLSAEIVALIDYSGGVARFIRKLKHQGVYVARGTVTSWYYRKKVPPAWAFKAMKKAYFPNFSLRKYKTETEIDVDTLLS